MSRTKYIRLLTTLSLSLGLLALLTLLPGSLLAQAPDRDPETIQACVNGTQSSGALYRVCMPSDPADWNGELVIYAHGYVPISEPLAIPSEAFLLSISLNGQGYGFATTSYYTNGLAVLPGLSDVQDLVTVFSTQENTPTKTYLVGFSEGGLITTLGVERHPNLFDGGLAMCAPNGDFLAQLTYITDFRLLTDHFFPDLLPGTAFEIPGSLMADWDTYFSDVVEPVITDPANEDNVAQILQVSQAPYTLSHISEIFYDALRLNVLGAMDAQRKLGGSPFDNTARVYSGSADDAALNAALPRYSADTAALEAVAQRETSGALSVPLVTAHTTHDPQTPYWHTGLYRAKVVSNDNLAQHTPSSYTRFGHCQFSNAEIQTAFDLLIEQVANPPAYQPIQRVYLPGLWR